VGMVTGMASDDSENQLNEHERLRRRPAHELIGRMLIQIGEILQSEVMLAQHELQGKIRVLAGAAGFVAMAGLLALLGGIAMLIVAISLLQLIVPLWAAALIAMVAAFALAGILAVAAKSIVMKAAPFVPERAIQSLKKDFAWVKTWLSSSSK